MKEKIKQITLYFMIFYTIAISLMMIFNVAISTKYIELSDSEDNLVKLNELKQELTKLKQNECTTSITDLIDIYRTTSYNGHISLREYYNQGTLLMYFQEAKETCHITDNEFQEYNFPYTLVTEVITKEELFQNYMFQYELNLKDILLRGIYEPFLTNTNYSITKRSELTTITNLVKLIKERNETHE